MKIPLTIVELFAILCRSSVSRDLVYKSVNAFNIITLREYYVVFLYAAKTFLDAK